MFRWLFFKPVDGRFEDYQIKSVVVLVKVTFLFRTGRKKVPLNDIAKLITL